ncbi:AAA family ATPase [Mucilaginibacter terrae]|uniref:AAA family ATPase n=1 Tax=Mucilaginibacter terrae TaxID=1955052 RepID=UPI00362EFDE8
METLTMSLNSIRHIEHSKIEIPLESGVYAFVGNNGCGKSTILGFSSINLKVSFKHSKERRLRFFLFN